MQDINNGWKEINLKTRMNYYISFLREKVATFLVVVVVEVEVVGEAGVCYVHGPICYDYWGHESIMGFKVLMT